MCLRRVKRSVICKFQCFCPFDIQQWSVLLLSPSQKSSSPSSPHSLKGFSQVSIATTPFAFFTKILKPLQFFIFIALGETSRSLPKNVPYWRQQTDVTETSFLRMFFKMLFYIIAFSILAIGKHRVM